VPEEKNRLRNTLRALDAAKNWIATAGLIVTWILLQFGGLLGPIRDALLPTAIAITVGALFRILMPLEQRISEFLRQDTMPSIAAALPRIAEITSQDRDTTEVRLLASTGGTALASLIPRVLASSPARHVLFILHVVDPDGVSARWFPDHWHEEVRTVVRRIKTKTWPSHVHWIVRSYQHLPVVGGVLINGKHLFLSFYRWRDFSGEIELSGSESEHRYVREGTPGSGFFFTVFRDWFEDSPSSLVWDSSAQR
jgi:hypothetical protein